MSRRTRTTVPTSTLLIKPEIVDSVAVKEVMTAQRQVTKLNSDKKAAPDLPVLTPGDYVYVKPPPNSTTLHGYMVESSTTPAPDHTTFEHQMVWYGGTGPTFE